MSILDKKSLQFELWHECNSKCKFCYLGNNNNKTPIKLKLKAINDALAFISNEENLKEYSVLSYIGGEFFQGQLETQEIKEAFFNLIRKTAELQINNIISEVWLMCTMTIGDQADLYESLNILQNEYNKANKSNLMEQIWLVTSYDTIGRFHTQKMLDTWDYHMKHIHEIYPSLKFNVCTILTQDLITKYLNDEFSFHDFQNEYNANFFFKQPSPGSTQPIHKDLPLLDQYYEAKQIMESKLPGFFPQRSTFLKFLIKFKQDCPELYDKLFNLVYRADDLYRNFNDEDTGHRMQQNHRNKITLEENIVGDEKDCGQNINKCGHLINYSGYIDSKECMICDRNLIKK